MSSKPLSGDDLEKEFQRVSAQELESGYQKTQPQKSGPLFSSPRGFYGPGVLSNTLSRATGQTPEEAYKQTTPYLETLLGLAGALRMPAAGPLFGSTVLGRMVSQGALQGGIANLGGHGAGEVLKQAGIGAGLQGGMEGAMWIPKFAANAKAATKALADYATETAANLKGYEAQKAFNKSFASVLEQLDQAGYKQAVQKVKDTYEKTLGESKLAYETSKQKTMTNWESQKSAQEASHASAVGAHSEQSGAKLSDWAKSKVEVWKDYPSTTEGLVDMVVGRGQQDVSKAYEAAMKAAAEQAKGKTAMLPKDAAEALGFSTDPAAMIANRGQADAFRYLQHNGPLGGGAIPVDAAELIKNMTGKSFGDTRGAYRAAADALEKVGVATGPAREQYKNAQGLMDLVDEAGALVRAGGKNTLDTEKIMQALLRRQNVDALRTRGLGDALRGGVPQAATGSPLAPRDIPKPVVPPFQPPPKPAMPAEPAPRYTPEATPQAEIPKPDIRSIKNPLAGHPWITGVAGEGLSAGMGLGHGWGMPFLAGATASNSMPKELVTRVPLSPEVQRVFQFLPGLLAALGQGAMNQYGMKPQNMNFDISAEGPPK